MRPTQPNGVLVVVITGAVGAVIGLALIKLVGVWCVPVGAVLGVLIGVVFVRAGKARGPGYSSMDGEDAVDMAATGCMMASCLGDLVSCFGILAFMLTALLGGTLLIFR